MKINGWDIALANARQWNVTPGFHEIKNKSEWVEGGNVPLLVGGTVDFKTITVKLLIWGRGRQDILRNVGDILSHLTEPVELELDRFAHLYKGVLTKHKHKEETRRRFHSLELTFDCYEFGREVKQTKALKSNDLSMQVRNPGNMETPVVVTVTGTGAVTLTGICRDANGQELATKLTNLSASNPVVLDGERGLFTEGSASKAKDIEIWALPSLKPGRNTITANAAVTLEVKFKPRYW